MEKKDLDLWAGILFLPFWKTMGWRGRKRGGGGGGGGTDKVSRLTHTCSHTTPEEVNWQSVMVDCALYIMSDLVKCKDRKRLYYSHTGHQYPY